MESRPGHSQKKISEEEVKSSKNDRDFYITHPLVVEYRVSESTPNGQSVSVVNKNIMSFSRVSLKMIATYMRSGAVPLTFTVQVKVALSDAPLVQKVLDIFTVFTWSDQTVSINLASTPQY